MVTNSLIRYLRKPILSVGVYNNVVHYDGYTNIVDEDWQKTITLFGIVIFKKTVKVNNSIVNGKLSVGFNK